MKTASLTVILTVYKRPHLLGEQLTAIENQTIKPEKIVLLLNNPAVLPQVRQITGSRKIHIIVSSINLKFHGRFAAGLLQETDYVCLYDDDAIPGERWHENCFNTFAKTGDAILGASGIILNGPSYLPNERIGSDGFYSLEITPVDLVGYSWFLKTDHLKYLWYERPVTLENGEDISLSYLGQKYGGLKTYVPPHPPDDTSLHGSIHPEYGRDSRGHSLVNFKEHFAVRDDLVKRFVGSGWKLVKEQE